VYKIGVCYGYQCCDERDKNFVLGVLATAGANAMAEKVEALATLRAIQVMLLRQTWKAMAEKAAAQQLSKEAGIVATRQLAKQLGINLTKRKALQAIPIIGAGVGSSVNAWWLKDIGWAARRAFQERWLAENQKLESV